jgi:translocator protein
MPMCSGWYRDCPFFIHCLISLHEANHGPLMSDFSLFKQTLGFLGCVAVSFTAASVGGLASASAVGFYNALVQPGWASPAWLFAPVWTVLYFLMALSAWLIWRSFGIQRARVALSLFIVQLVVNALWSWVFFVWHQGALAFYGILVLWGLILGTIISFWRLHSAAGVLLLPYIAWVTFAAALAFSLWQLNPRLLA